MKNIYYYLKELCIVFFLLTFALYITLDYNQIDKKQSKESHIITAVNSEGYFLDNNMFFIGNKQKGDTVTVFSEIKVTSDFYYTLYFIIKYTLIVLSSFTILFVSDIFKDLFYDKRII